MRGEHLDAKRSAIDADGSSPHAWGTPGERQLFLQQTRFIPTCVGNTHPWGAPRRATPVHPHMRGEHVCLLSVMLAMPGSSPHAWGTHLRRLLAHFDGRFIPTCVGNTIVSTPSLLFSAVHPHMRGEHSLKLS